MAELRVALNMKRPVDTGSEIGKSTYDMNSIPIHKILLYGIVVKTITAPKW